MPSNEIRNLLGKLGQDTETEHLKRTPERVEKFYREFLGHPDTKLEEITCFPCPPRQTTVIVNNLDVTSMCGHHLLPFFGKAWIGYLPNGKMAGLSKFQRVINKFAHELTCQEDIGSKVVDFLAKNLQANGIIVVLQCTHTCMVVRGVYSPNSTTTTITTSGLFKTDISLQQAFLSAIKLE
jgi:GTP cyclohydrolase I